MSLIDLSVLCVFVDAVNKERDPYENNHGKHVATRAWQLAKAAGLSDEQAHLVRQAARIHDLGKLAITESILNKPAKPTEAERIMLEGHTLIGYRMFLYMDFSQDISDIVADVIKHHHENWDGSGYPDGLKGEQISLPARIVRICDFYDARTDHRPEQRGKVPIANKTALDVMIEQYASSFDPELLKLFVKMIMKG